MTIEVKAITRKIGAAACAAGLALLGATHHLRAQNPYDVWTTHGPDRVVGVKLFAIDPQNPATVYAGTLSGIFKTTDGGGAWRMISPLIVSKLVVDPQTPSTLYAGVPFSTPGGVMKSTNGGEDWGPVNDGLMDFHVLALAIDPQMPTTLYAGTYKGVFKSVDAGGQWTAINNGITGGFPDDFCNANVRVLTVDPQTTTTLYTVVERACSGPGYEHGIFKSTDGGDNWSAVNNGLIDSNSVHDLEIDPQTPTTLYAVPDGYSGIHKSTDGGNSWTTVYYNGQPLWGIRDLAIDPLSPDIIYATSSSAVGRSTDGGGTWIFLRDGLQGVNLSPVAVDPQVSTTIYVGSPLALTGAFKSTDSGNSWTGVNTGLIVPVPVSALVVNPQTPTTLFAGTVGYSVWKSVDGANSWSVANPWLQSVTALAIDPQTPTTLYASQVHDDYPAGVYKSTDGGSTFRVSNAGLPWPYAQDVRALAVDGFTPATLYAGTAAGVFKSIDDAASWSATGLTSPAFALAIDPQITTTLYAGTSDGLFKSTDGGTTWSSIDGGLISVIVYAIAIDPQMPTNLYVGARSAGIDIGSAGVYKSTDGGDHWSAANTGLSVTAVSSLAIDPQVPATVYAGTMDGGVFKTTNGGASWAAMNDGLTNLGIAALTIDPQAPGNLYAATSGVFAVTMTPRLALTVSRSGSGSGAVTSSPAGIDCGTDCSEWFGVGTPVTLTAIPDSGVVAGWSGCDTDSGAGTTSSCTVTMNESKSVVATFVGSPLGVSLR